MKIQIFMCGEGLGHTSRCLSVGSRLKKDGFDVVIGNPPYGAKLSKEFRKWAREFFETAVGEVDSYTLFVEGSIKLLCELGVLAFIIPDTWLTLIQSEKFRRWILEKYYLKELVMLNFSRIL